DGVLPVAIGECVSATECRSYHVGLYDSAPHDHRQTSTNQDRRKSAKYDADHRYYLAVRDWRLASRFAGLAVHQEPKHAFAVAVGHDPDRQQHGFAGQAFEPDVDLHVPAAAGHIGLLAGLRLQGFQTLPGQGPRISAADRKLLD